MSLARDRAPKTAGNVLLRGAPTHFGQLNEVLLEVTHEGQIAGILAEGTDGATTEYWFSGTQENLPVGDDRFRFKPPAGTEVVSGDFGQ